MALMLEKSIELSLVLKWLDLWTKSTKETNTYRYKEILHRHEQSGNSPSVTVTSNSCDWDWPIPHRYCPESDAVSCVMFTNRSPPAEDSMYSMLYLSFSALSLVVAMRTLSVVHLSLQKYLLRAERLNEHLTTMFPPVLLFRVVFSGGFPSSITVEKMNNCSYYL